MHPTSRRLSSLLRLGAILLLLGCGTLPDGRRWGDDATPLPGWDRVAWAAQRAILDPGTWAPAAGAAVLGVGKFDRRISNWAKDRTPIYGSQDSAKSASTTLRSVVRAATLGTALATPSGDTADDWVASKLKGLAVEWTASEATSLSARELKHTIGRERPSGNDHSIPSSCASDAFDYATLTSRNLDSIPLPSSVRSGLQAGAYTIAGASAWARVEAGAHYPSDVLAGAALGHFLGAFIHDAFLGLPDPDAPQLEIVPSTKGVSVALTLHF